MPALRPDPDWHGAAAVLVEGCARLPDAEQRVRWLQGLALSLGDALYPAFLKVLWLVGEQADAAAQRAVADTLVQALASGRLPTGRHAAWGSAGGAAGRSSRAFGPLEYLCAWHAQPSSDALPAPGFDRAARALLGLVAHSAAARQLYCAKLLADAEDPLDGGWSRAARDALKALAETWSRPGAHERDAVDAFLHTLHGPARFGPPVAVAWTLR